MTLRFFTLNRRVTLIALILLSLTIWLRLYNLQYANNYVTDEGNNGYVALRIVRDHEFILRGVSAHYGAVAHYITAGFFALFGPSVFVARLTPATASIGASIILFVWLYRIAGIKGSILGLLLAAFSPWMVTWSRFTWEMAPNVLFIALGALFLYTYLRNHRIRFAAAAGFFLGMAANGHLYIVIQAIPYALAILLTKTSWRNKFLALVSAAVGGMVALGPLLYASWQKGWDLFSNYERSGGSDQPETWAEGIARIIGVIATFFETLPGPLLILFILAFFWTIRLAIKRNELARFIVMAIATGLLVMPFINTKAPVDQEWCAHVSSWLGQDQCIGTKSRYFDIFYPLPILLVAWFGAYATRKSLSSYLLVATLVITPLVPQTLDTITTVSKFRLEHLEPALNMLPDGSCIVLNSAHRDYVRLWTIAGQHHVYKLEEYRLNPPVCKNTFLISAFVERHGSHLESVDTVHIKGYPAWYIYRIIDPTVRDLTCPAMLSSGPDTGLVRHSGFTPSESDPESLECGDDCTATWRFVIDESYQNTPLHILADCNAGRDEGWLEISTDNGQTWNATCDRAPFNRPETRWIDSETTITASSSRPLEVQLRGHVNEGEPIGIFRELRACYDVPVNSEEMIHEHPIGWE